MTKRLHPGTLLLVAACTAACGEVGSYYDDDQDPSNTGSLDGGGLGSSVPDAGGSDAAGGDGGVPWDARFGDGGGAGDASTWDASPAPDAGGNSWDASVADAGGYDAAQPDAGGGGGSDSGTPGNQCSTLTYNSFGQQFLSSYCTGCHGAVGAVRGIRLDTLENLVSRKGGAKSAVLSGAMPQGTNRPSTADRERFGQWIDCGPN
jgi:hypothetical protein